MDKTTGSKSNNIGAGWLNADGSISLKINPCVVLHYNPNMVLTLFPNTNKKGYRSLPHSQETRDDYEATTPPA